jgi:hypothetical protein
VGTDVGYIIVVSNCREACKRFFSKMLVTEAFLYIMVLRGK